jgi:O-antigen/teichoic acid export membrane protein
MPPMKPISSESLSKKVVRGGMWVFGLRITNRGLGFIRTIILARLLAPSDFGLLGIAMLAISTLETFSQTGFQAALIQKKENVESYLDTAWTVSAIRGVILFLILFLSAPLVATFFNSPQATLVIKVIAVSTLLSGFRNIGILFFQKELEFNKQFFYELSATLVDITIAITLAFMLRNVWALVWGGLAANFVRLFMSYILHPYRPHARFDKGEFKELFSFGKWVLGSSILIFLIMQGDDIFVGKMLGATALGLYQMAYLISNLPATEITHVISQVTFPAYSRLQNDGKRLREAYLDVLQLTAFLSFPIAGLIFVLAPDFTKIFLGEKWMPMVPAMQVLAIFGLIRALAATTGPFFHGSGNPHILTKLAVLQVGILATIIYPLTVRWGILGTSIAVVISNFITQGVTVFKIVKLTEARALDVLRLVVAPTVTSTAMVLCLWVIQTFLGSSIVVFIGLIVSGMLVYLAVMYIIDRKCDLNYRAILEQLRIGM